VAVDGGFAEGVEGAADLAFDQAEDEQGQADHGDQGGDAAVVLQVDRGDGEGSFRRGVGAFDGFLAFVVQQYLCGVRVIDRQVGQQGLPAVGGGVGVDRGLVERPGQGGSVPVIVYRFAPTRLVLAITLRRASTAAVSG
jgi:hypothetical protein